MGRHKINIYIPFTSFTVKHFQIIFMLKISFMLKIIFLLKIIFMLIGL